MREQKTGIVKRKRSVEEMDQEEEEASTPQVSQPVPLSQSHFKSHTPSPTLPVASILTASTAPPTTHYHTLTTHCHALRLVQRARMGRGYFARLPARSSPRITTSLQAPVEGTSMLT